MNRGLLLALGLAATLVETPMAQPIPVAAYGLWDRGESDLADPRLDFVVGLEVEAEWAEVNPQPHRFDFSTLQAAIDRACAHRRYLRLSLSVGPAAPEWLYATPGFRRVTTSGGNDKDKFPQFPDYRSPAYRDALFELIREFAGFLRGQPNEAFRRIAFVQVKTGCTGDEVPYKGRVDNPDDAIGAEAWEAHRRAVFREYQRWFQDVPDRRVVLLFNRVDPTIPDEAEAWAWLVANIDPKVGFGVKGGAFNRGHHLTGEQPFATAWRPYLVDPQGLRLFSASEMDQSWNKGSFAINPALGFTWAALAGLNVGLSSCSVSASAMEYALAHPEVLSVFRQFSWYAQQVDPRVAEVAFSVFHEGLNAADTVKFPEAQFGRALPGNTDRYLAIAAAYADRGARVDDPRALTRGQVYQRDQQSGFNDVGWQIAEGNIERFLTQIAPDTTSTGWFRVRGPLGPESSPYDRFARSFDATGRARALLFRFDPHLFDLAQPRRLVVSVTWLDRTAGSTWRLEYPNRDGGLGTALATTGVGDGQWKTVPATLTDVDVGRTLASGAHLALVNTDDRLDLFHGIEVRIER